MYKYNSLNNITIILGEISQLKKQKIAEKLQNNTVERD